MLGSVVLRNQDGSRQDDHPSNPAEIDSTMTVSLLVAIIPIASVTATGVDGGYPGRKGRPTLPDNQYGSREGRLRFNAIDPNIWHAAKTCLQYYQT
jgi:hypothetical protein